MKIHFTEAESGEKSFFQAHLEGYEVSFSSSLDDVEKDVEILSVFIYSIINAEFLDSHPNLKLIATRSTGTDHIDIEECRKRGVAVSMVPSYGEHTIAEHTFTLILALSRRLRESLEANKKHRFSYESIRGFDLNGKTLGVVGSGRIGLQVIRIARAFRMKVIAYDVRILPFIDEILGFKYVPLDELMVESDIISLHMPLTPESYHLLNRETLAKCKPGALIINTSRGGLIDTEALIEALDNKIVGGAGLDVLEEERVLRKEAVAIIGDQIVSKLHGEEPSEKGKEGEERLVELKGLMKNSELISRPNVVFTPHVAFNSQEAVARIGETTINNIVSFLNGKLVNTAY